MPPKIAEISRTMAINATKDAKIIIVLNYFKLNNNHSASRWQPFNSIKRRNVGTAFCEEGTTKYPYKSRHTHAKWREHLMCLLLICSLNFGRFTSQNNSLNATNTRLPIR